MRQPTGRVVVEPLRAVARRWPRLRPPRPSWGWALVAAVLAAGTLLRFWDLGPRAMHHDESLDAFFSWRLAEFFDYVHNPLLHGPFRFFATAAVFKGFGDGDYTARVPPAFFGSVLIALPLLLRDRLGKAGAVTAALFLAFSPTLLYFSRFAREDIYVAFWTMLLAVFLWRYLARPHAGYLAGLAGALALSFATKETTFITVAIFIGYLDLMVAADLHRQWAVGGGQGRLRSGAALAALALGAWALVALWPLTRRRREPLGLRTWPRAADPLLLLGTLSLPQYAAGVQAPLEALGVRMASPQGTFGGQPVTTEILVGATTVIVLVTATALVGLAWNWRRWLLAAGLFYFIYALLFTTLFTSLEGFSTGIWGSLDYWLNQQDVRRGAQPWFYYLMLLPVYEFLALAFALVALGVYARRGDAFGRFLAFWTLSALLAYSLAGEKMPWLTVHLALPLSLLGARLLGSWLEAGALAGWPWVVGARRPRPLMGLLAAAGLAASGAALVAYSPGLTSRAAGLALMAAVLVAAALLARRSAVRWRAVGGAVAAGLLLTFSLNTAVTAAFPHGDTPVELLVYTQTSPDLQVVKGQIDAVAAASGLGPQIPIIVDTADGFAWPWAWYLRDYRNVGYVDFGSGYTPPTDAVLLVNSVHAAVVSDLVERGQGVEVTYRHRAWFPEAYKGVGWGDLVASALRSSTWREWWRFLSARQLSSNTGAVTAAAFFPTRYRPPGTAAVP